MAKNAIIPIFIPHAGCPNDCVFCDQRSISGSVGVPSFAEVAETIGDSLARLSADTCPELAFYGGSFTAIDRTLQEGYLAAAAPFLRAGRLSSIRVSTRPDAIDAEVLARLARYGVKTVELGAQSMDDGVLRASRRGHTADDTRQAVRSCRSAGFALVLQMMLGLPGDTAAGALQTARELAALAPDGVRIYPTVVLEGTALAALYRQGSYTPITLEETAELAAELIAVFSARGIPILRIGLNTSETLASKAIAGAYHPALGELCYARWYLHRMRALLQTAGEASAVTVRVAEGRASVAAGHRRENLRTLAAEFPAIRRIAIAPTLTEPDAIEIEKNESPR